jgi:hypothetical protein
MEKTMTGVWRMIGVLVMTVVAAVSASSQEATTTQTTQPQTTQQSDQTTQQQTTQQSSTQATTSDYVFPTPRERFKRYVTSTVGPTRLAWSAASAGINQWRDHPEEWEQGMKGYGKRYASSLGQNAIQQTVTYGLDSAMGLDTGFQRSKRQGFFPRFKDALIQNVTSRTRSGNRVISVPRLAGVYTGAIVARETWYPDRYDFKDGLKSGTTTFLTSFGINLLREFVINW